MVEALQVCLNNVKAVFTDSVENDSEREKTIPLCDLICLIVFHLCFFTAVALKKILKIIYIYI